MRLVLASLLVTVAACDPDLAPAPPPPDPDAVHIGLLEPFSGREASRAIDHQRAAQLAVFEINEAGGINGQPVDLIARDSKSREPEGPQVSIDAVRELAAAGAVAVVGPDTSALVLALTDTLVAEGLPLISATASAAVVAEAADADLIWRTCASDNLQGAALAARIRRDGHQRVAIIHIDDTYGAGLAATLGAELQAGGGELLATVAYPSDQLADFEPQVAELLAPGTPDAIVLVGFALDSAGVAAALAEQRLSPPPGLYGVDGNHNQSFLDNAPAELVVGMRFIAPGNSPDDPNLARFRAAHEAKLGQLPFRTEFTYDAIYLIAIALVSAGENSATAVRDHLRQVSRADSSSPVMLGVGSSEIERAVDNAGADLDFAGATGAIDFDTVGDITAATFTIREVVEAEDGLRFEDLEYISLP